MIPTVTSSLALVSELSRGVWLVQAHSRWMGVNLGLALVPLALALALFRGRRTRGVLWWTGALAFLLFLPNAPYVLTDIIHLTGDVRAAGSRRAAVFGVLPLYGVFMLVGMESYTLCVRLLRSYLERAGLASLERVVVPAVHLICAVGVVLGRLQRLNSWDVLRPSRLAGGISGALAHPVLIVVTAAVIAVGAAALDLVTRACHRLLREPLRPS
jgi:uncharacterized membrane protein